MRNASITGHVMVVAAATVLKRLLSTDPAPPTNEGGSFDRHFVEGRMAHGRSR